MMAAFEYLLVFFVVPVFATKDTITRNKTITGNVGDIIGMKCFEQPAKSDQPGRISWKFLYKDDYVKVADCEVTPAIGKWENILYGHQLMGNDNECDNGIAYMTATNPGEFSYKCEEMDEDDRYVVTEMYFRIFIEFDSSVSPCLVKRVPKKGNLTFDIICTNFNLHGFPTEVENNTKLFLRNNNTRITPDITLPDRIIARIEFENFDSISEYYCINQNVSSACVADNTTLHNPIGITPIVNQVPEGASVSFECSCNGLMETGEEYDWRISRHITPSRTPTTTSSIFEIRDVELKDGGVTVICSVNVNGTVLFSEAFLEVIPRPNNSTPTNLSKSTCSSYGKKQTTLGTTPLNVSTSNPPDGQGEYYVISVSIIFAVCIFVLVLFNLKTKQLLRRFLNREPSVHAGTEIIILDSDVGQVFSPRNQVSSSTVRRPSDHLPTSIAGSSMGMHEVSGSSLQNLEHLNVKDSTISTKHPRQSPSSSHSLESRGIQEHLYHVGKYSLPIPTSAAQPIPQSPNDSKTLETRPCTSETVLHNNVIPTDEKQNATSFLVKMASEQSFKGIQSIPLTRKGSATNQPLPPIPNSPGSQDIKKLPSSSELPEAVTKPMTHSYATIEGEGQRQNISSTPDKAGFHGPSVLNGNPDFLSGYTENLGKCLGEEESKISDRDSVFTPECNAYSVPYADDRVDMSTKSMYYTSDQDNNNKGLSTEEQVHRHGGGSASSCPNRFSRHIYEMPGDDIATEVNCQSISEESFYFTLECDDDDKL